MGIAENILRIQNELPSTVKLVAVSKFKPESDVMQAYDAGQRLFGENRPQELKQKAEALPKDIQWHFIGHLQSNKIKMVVPYATLIHSVSSEKLVREIDDYCIRNSFHVEALLEIHIASEETKQGFTKEEVLEMLDRFEQNLSIRPKCIKFRGVMGMASFTEDTGLVRSEFSQLVDVFDAIRARNYSFISNFDQKSFGMSHDYHIAIEMGATLIRVGTSIFGPRM